MKRREIIQKDSDDRNKESEIVEKEIKMPRRYDNICFSCMQYKNTECFGGSKCGEYRRALEVSKEEKLARILPRSVLIINSSIEYIDKRHLYFT